MSLFTFKQQGETFFFVRVCVGELVFFQAKEKKPCNTPATDLFKSMSCSDQITASDISSSSLPFDAPPGCVVSLRHPPQGGPARRVGGGSWAAERFASTAPDLLEFFRSRLELGAEDVLETSLVTSSSSSSSTCARPPHVLRARSSARGSEPGFVPPTGRPGVGAQRTSSTCTWGAAVLALFPGARSDTSETSVRFAWHHTIFNIPLLHVFFADIVPLPNKNNFGFTLCSS